MTHKNKLIKIIIQSASYIALWDWAQSIVGSNPSKISIVKKYIHRKTSKYSRFWLRYGHYC